MAGSHETWEAQIGPSATPYGGYGVQKYEYSRSLALHRGIDRAKLRGMNDVGKACCPRNTASPYTTTFNAAALDEKPEDEACSANGQVQKRDFFALTSIFRSEEINSCGVPSQRNPHRHLQVRVRKESSVLVRNATYIQYYGALDLHRITPHWRVLSCPPHWLRRCSEGKSSYVFQVLRPEWLLVPHREAPASIIYVCTYIHTCVHAVRVSTRTGPCTAFFAHCKRGHMISWTMRACCTCPKRRPMAARG